MLKAKAFILALLVVNCHAFFAPRIISSSGSSMSFQYQQRIRESCLYETEEEENATNPFIRKKAKVDMSKSGNKRDRLNKLAELEEEMVETDKSFILKAAGGFVALLLVLLVVAFASGVVDPV
mmetsp:Transcript_14084/g.17242  ORF Transcript_14084/g.17242 Transcript_14084/m.17242 type:complete len:123 (+) Transcript_14084:77-445(+)|eukprot:CAMPEP_0194427562 /NCGR_PEP_ID=MMETSP0176-20130528/37435_1 /TAXON_ID=216777 /ORGANISM="Proboscia alata, Strain PI-D3" /LENGTH=122 /DNA_ID=CAMNT_0039239389 /DNA_START=74 /DNA_END=442 /DNA_ORIENTATION=-